MQLEMYRKAAAVEAKPVPSGVTVRNIRDSREDIHTWVEMCKCGIFEETVGNEGYDSTILSDPLIVPERDVYILELDGKPAATITAVIDAEAKIGTVHMVDSFPWSRGKGIGTYMMNLVLCRFEKEGMIWSKLKTDDFRIPAIKSYIRAGYRPVNVDADMEARWAKILKEIGVSEIEMYNPDFTIYKTIVAE